MACCWHSYNGGQRWMGVTQLLTFIVEWASHFTKVKHVLGHPLLRYISLRKNRGVSSSNFHERAPFKKLPVQPPPSQLMATLPFVSIFDITEGTQSTDHLNLVCLVRRLMQFWLHSLCASVPFPRHDVTKYINLKDNGHLETVCIYWINTARLVLFNRKHV